MSLGKEVNAVYRNMDAAGTELHFARSLRLCFFFSYFLQFGFTSKEYSLRNTIFPVLYEATTKNKQISDVEVGPPLPIPSKDYRSRATTPHTL